MIHPWANARYVLKLDPDKRLPRENWQPILDSRPDLILVGGTQNITLDKVNQLLEEVRLYLPSCPIWQEISEFESIHPDFDGYGLPCVLNSNDPYWMIGAHVRAIEKWGPLIPWDKVVIEGYLVLNPDSAVGRLTGTNWLTRNSAAAFAKAAGSIWNLSTLYIEYSGVWGDMETVKQIRNNFAGHLVYGGGVNSLEHVQACAPIADSIVVGNACYGDEARHLPELSSRIRENTKNWR